MAAQSINEAYRNLARVEDTSARDRTAGFLRPLSMAMIGLYTLGLAIMVINLPDTVWISFVVVGLALVLSITVWYLNQAGFVAIAAHLFCAIFNIEVFILFFLNVFYADSFVDAGRIGMALSMNVLFAGMLLNTRKSFYVAAINTLLVFLTYYFRSYSLVAALRETFPIMAFTWLMALVSWLYQSSLSTVRSRLNAARQEVMKSELLRRDLQIARELQERLYPAAPASSGTSTRRPGRSWSAMWPARAWPRPW
jgi:hypothetical protein